MNDYAVKVWEEKIIIPTYGIGKPDKNPMFFEKRVYQGSSGVVYPNPVIEKIYDEKTDKGYTALYLENKYLKIMVLPEIGGRVQMAYDKIKERHFIYYNQVIKPALVGLTGPWVSGGIEFNWPQHHRPSTFEPIDYTLAENKDGSKTIWVNEVETMFHTKGMAGFTLYPDKAYLEVKAKLYNRTSLPQTFLWWANPAVKVNDDYQSIFPPDVNAVFDHGRRDVSAFPIAKGTYYKVDYSPGTDISRYKNIPVPTSYMAIDSDYDFLGGYEHDTQAGVLHVANHHISPGKKQWTWGYSDFGQAWNRNLTDEDGPYIEFMTGVYTDNQPDFSWIMPYEEKTFSQYFLPYRELGAVKNATKDILVNIEKLGDTADLKIYTTSELKSVKIQLFVTGDLVFEETLDASPEKVIHKKISIAANTNEKTLLLKISDSSGQELIRYEPSKNKHIDIPGAAKPALDPQAIESNEQLFLTAQHLEQYRHATFSPVPYYEEALKRDPKDIRNNNGLGAWHLKRGRFAKAEQFFRKAIETATARNANPYDSEPYYNLGLSLKFQGKPDEAYTTFYKATWSNSWQDSAFFAIAQIDITRGNFEMALEHINHSLDKNAGNNKAYVLKAAALRKLRKFEEAVFVSSRALSRDAFNLGALFEMVLTYRETGNARQIELTNAALLKLSRETAQNTITYALDYADAGLYSEAIELLALCSDKTPLIYYHLALFADKLNDKEGRSVYLEKARLANPYLCFPNRLQDISALQFAIENNALDAKAPYYLGNLWYDKRQYAEAIANWELSVKIDANYPTVHRNLGIAYFNKLGDAQRALESFRKAFSLDKTDARILMELDQLQKRMNKAPTERLQFLEDNLHLVEERDDLYLERTALYNFMGEYQKACDLVMARKFHPWEGGEGRVSMQYLYSLVELAKENIEKGDYQKAINQLDEAQTYPHNLGEGKFYLAQENDIFYWLGCAYHELGQTEKANEFFYKATVGLSEPGEAMFYNDQQPDKIFYQGLAWQKLGDNTKAGLTFTNLLSYGQAHLDDEVKLDYFAVSLPNMLIFDDDLTLRNKIHCLYISGLGLSGLNRIEESVNALNEVLKYDAMHFGAIMHKKMQAAL